jgi:hypothetical protein
MSSSGLKRLLDDIDLHRRQKATERSAAFLMTSRLEHKTESRFLARLACLVYGASEWDGIRLPADIVFPDPGAILNED